jgi:hypothetical protein
MLAVQSTVRLAKRLSRRRIDSLIEKSPTLRERMESARAMPGTPCSPRNFLPDCRTSPAPTAPRGRTRYRRTTCTSPGGPVIVAETGFKGSFIVRNRAATTHPRHKFDSRNSVLGSRSVTVTAETAAQEGLAAARAERHVRPAAGEPS